uniref:Choline transporter-like protein n=1 Tax=Cyclopterus lumpus TaxID=8103 RepID=A0A8C2WQP6_CYCLU
VIPANDTCMYPNLTCSPKTFNRTNITKVCPGSQCMFAFCSGESVYHRYILVLHLYNLFVFFWLVNIITALGQYTLAGAFASYYWARKKPNDIPAFPVCSSFIQALRYHTGSLAFGSLIVAVAQIIQIVPTKYLDMILKGSIKPFSRFNFCASSKDSFLLLMRNVIRMSVLDKVTHFLFFLGKLLISGSIGVLAFFFFTYKLPVIQEEVPSLNYIWVPLVTGIVVSYMIAQGFCDVYSMCVDRPQMWADKPCFTPFHSLRTWKNFN